jgi:hypothetical protein
MSQRLRAVLAVSTSVVLLGGIGAAFWYQDIQYSRPTPRPAGVRTVAVGTAVSLPPAIETLRAAHPGKPLHLHFFNPDCPCSRFNVDHVRALVKTHGDAVLFVAVLRDADAGTLERAFRNLALDIPFVIDDGRIGQALGVYSTPHAVILDEGARLYYEGNYNLTRYCRDRETEFARIALEQLRLGAPAPRFPAGAAIAVGCPLPERRSSTEGRL